MGGDGSEVGMVLERIVRKAHGLGELSAGHPMGEGTHVMRRRPRRGSTNEVQIAMGEELESARVCVGS